jgi:3-oxoacyl-[acyl-carrier protein] reductase
MGLLDGKTGIVTGGAQGIGFAIAKRFHDEGANVVVCELNRSSGKPWKNSSELISW